MPWQCKTPGCMERSERRIQRRGEGRAGWSTERRKTKEICLWYAGWSQVSVLEVKSWFRGKKYMVETGQVLPAMLEAIFIEPAIDTMAELGRVNPAVNPISSAKVWLFLYEN